MPSPFEISRWLARPVTLVRFDRQHLSWRYTDADRNIPIDGETFLAVRGGVTRGNIRDTSNAKKSELKVTIPYLLDPAASELPITQELGDNWRPYPPGDDIVVTVMETQFGDPDEAVEVRWSGFVIAPEFTDTQLTLNCAPSKSGTRKSGVAPRWCRVCPLVLYSQGRGMCNVDPADHALPAELSGVVGLTLSATAFASLPSGRLRGGFVQWERPDGLLERRTITAHIGNVITVNYGGRELEPGLSVTAYPGCAHTDADCHDYFDNRANNGGAKFLPVKNLFDGNRHIP